MATQKQSDAPRAEKAIAFSVCLAFLALDSSALKTGACERALRWRRAPQGPGRQVQ